MPAQPPTELLAAMTRLDELQVTAELVAVLRGAERNGLLRRLGTPQLAQSLADEMGVATGRLETVLRLLAAYGIVAERSDGWALTAEWAPLVLGRTPARFDDFLGMHRVRAEQFEAALDGGDDYWQLTPEDRLIVARGISPNPAVPATVAMAGNLGTMDGVVAALEAGGRVLELGCGIASRLCAVLQAFPAAAAVGVELEADLVAEARRQAAEVGVADRLTLVVGDASTYEADGEFDLVGWSQFFFPEPTRAPTLAVAFRALRPGGWLRMPALSDGVAPEPGSADDRELAAYALLMDLWQVPMRSTVELVDEVRAAGFTDVEAEPGAIVSMVRARRPA